MKDTKMFPITSICKDDILACFEGKDSFEQARKIVEKMKDDEMRYLASQMADVYMRVFWDDLRAIFEERFMTEEQKKLE